MNYVPESPRWLLARNNKAKREEAKDILEQAAKKNGTWKESTEEKLNLLIEGTEIDQKKQAQVEELKFLGKLIKIKVQL